MVSRVLYWVGSHERGTLIAFALIALGTWAFVELVDEVFDGDSVALDESLLLALRSPADPDDPLGPVWLEELARDVTGLGSAGMITMLTLSAAGFLVLQARSHLAAYLVLAVGSGTLVSFALKHAFDRPRPDLVVHGQMVYTSSFPSGHSMLSAVAFFTVGALLSGAQPSRALKAYLLGLATLLSVAVGVTRVYLGVHWPTDVLAGWTAGAVWALLCWSLARYLRRRGDVE